MLPLVFVCVVFLTACVKYQYSTVSSNLATTDHQEFYLENDSLKIKYSFWGYGGPVTISIYNKLNVPLYVDWKQSALVLNDLSHTYWQNKSSLQADEYGYQVALTPLVSSTSATISGEIRADEATSFIAPNAYKQVNMLLIKPDFTKLEGSHKPERVKIYTIQGPRTALRYAFQQEDTPLKFRSYLTLSSEPSFAHPLVFESEFWVSEVMQTGTSPEKYMDERINKNTFYNSKLTGYGSVVGVLGLLAVGVILSQE